MGKITGVWLIKYRTEDGGDNPPRSLPTLLAVLVDDMEGGGSV